MEKIKGWSLQLAFALSAVLFALPNMCFGATTANIALSGTVVEVISVAVDNATFDFGDPATDTLTNQQVAIVTVNSNSADGYTLTLANANPSFSLVNGASSIAYTLDYDGAPLTWGASVQLETDDGTGGNISGQTKNLTVSLTADSTLPAGSYTDTLTLTIAGN
ncbi:MAG: hypothetical protein K0S07_441 [Chlamydiales bacterium]|jgi:spore coat protein U-like protein|nr:hypothetical protein [Chlamydiales bacterium]